MKTFQQELREILRHLLPINPLGVREPAVAENMRKQNSLLLDQAQAAITAVVERLIGEDKHEESNSDEYEWNLGQNEVRAELRKKLTSASKGTWVDDGLTPNGVRIQKFVEESKDEGA